MAAWTCIHSAWSSDGEFSVREIVFFHGVCLTACYRWMKREYRHGEVALGIVLGGGKR